MSKIDIYFLGVISPVAAALVGIMIWLQFFAPLPFAGVPAKQQASLRTSTSAMTRDMLQSLKDISANTRALVMAAAGEDPAGVMRTIKVDKDGHVLCGEAR